MNKSRYISAMNRGDMPQILVTLRDAMQNTNT